MYDRKKAIVEIVLAGGRRMPLEVDISVWNGPKSELLPPDEAKWSPTSFLRSQFYENIAGPLDRIVHLSQPGPEGSIQTKNTNPTRPPMSADVLEPQGPELAQSDTAIHPTYHKEVQARTTVQSFILCLRPPTTCLGDFVLPK
jgi:hypothetical protein